MSFASLKRYGKRVVGYQETLPVVSVSDYFSGCLNNPVQKVGGHLISSFCSPKTSLILGQGLLVKFVPNLNMDNEI